jgi:two-component system, chemotaxis family, chemotaxis protein CheY
MKAIVADDSKAVRTLLTELLEHSGFDVTQVPNGAEALTQLRAEPETDLVLTDWNMPVMTGIEFLETIRADARLQDVCVVMVTMESDFASVRRAFRSGVNDYVLKPCSMTTVREKLSDLGFMM